MLDMELLALAAKAVGIKTLPSKGSDLGLLIYDGGGYEPDRYWNPLTCNKDALQLALTLGAYDCITPGGKGLRGINGETDPERLAQVRRALVCAAAKQQV